EAQRVNDTLRRMVTLLSAIESGSDSRAAIRAAAEAKQSIANMLAPKAAVGTPDSASDRTRNVPKVKLPPPRPGIAYFPVLEARGDAPAAVIWEKDTSKPSEALVRVFGSPAAAVDVEHAIIAARRAEQSRERFGERITVQFKPSQVSDDSFGLALAIADKTL